MMMHWGSGGISRRLLNLGTRWKRAVSFTPRPLYPRGKSPRYSLDRRLGEPQSRSGHSGCEYKNSHHCPFRELNPGRAAFTLVSIQSYSGSKPDVTLEEYFALLRCGRKISGAIGQHVIYCHTRGPFEKFVDWRQFAAFMQREAVTLMPNCSGGGSVVVA
jgi:hypothetical protein